LNCGLDPDMTLDEWTNSMLIPLDGGRYPISGTMELTERCNLTCKHCFINKPANSVAIKDQELNKAEWFEVIDQMANTGCLFLLITGGEPLLHPDFEEILVHTRKSGMLVSLFSNGTLLTPRIVDLLAEWGLQSLEISLYGATQETYERVTGQPGSFRRCLEGIELAQQRGLKLGLKSVLMTINKHELPQMKALASDYGLDFRYDSLLWPRIDGNLISKNRFQLSAEEMLSLDRDDVDRYQDLLETSNNYKDQIVRAGKVFNCGAAHRSFHVDAKGYMSPCIMVRRPAYSILEYGFVEAWEKVGTSREMLRLLGTQCESCRIGALCRQCPGWSLAVHDDYETPVDEICEFAHIRANELLIHEV